MLYDKIACFIFESTIQQQTHLNKYTFKQKKSFCLAEVVVKSTWGGFVWGKGWKRSGAGVSCSNWKAGCKSE